MHKDAANNIDWEKLARNIGSICNDCSEHSATSLACQAIEMIMGFDVWRSAVDHYISHKPGYELARSILWHIHPLSGMERCYELYNNSDDIDTRRSAVELLRVVADGRVLPWIPRFLTDSDDSIQLWGPELSTNSCGQTSWNLMNVKMSWN